MIEKPIVTISGKKKLLDDKLKQRIIQDISQEGIEWCRRLDKNPRLVYIDVDLVDFDPSIKGDQEIESNRNDSKIIDEANNSNSEPIKTDQSEENDIGKLSDDLKATVNLSNEVQDSVNNSPKLLSNSPKTSDNNHDDSVINDDHKAFFNRRLLGQPILHTFLADKSDFEAENKKSQFEEWIGQVQASSCTEWAIIIIEDGDFKAQIGTALFKSKLQSSASQSNTSSSSIGSVSNHHQSHHSGGAGSFLDRVKKSLSTMFNADTNSDRWLTLVNQNPSGTRSASETSKAQESYAQFMKKFRNIIMASFSKQIELFEEQLQVQREIRNDKNWDFFTYFSMQEELAFAMEFLTLFDEALMQYDLLDALFSEFLKTNQNSHHNHIPTKHWTSFNQWSGLCLDLNSDHHHKLRQRIIDKKASLLDLRNYLFSKQSDLMLLQNQPWRVAASTIGFLQNCIREHDLLSIDYFTGSLDSWAFISALEVLQKCECYSCTSTMENYSYHTVDIWNYARQKLIDLGNLFQLMPGTGSGQINKSSSHQETIDKLFEGLGEDPHRGVSYQKNDLSPQARLKDALANSKQFAHHLIEISELTLGTYKHIGRKRHALLIGKDLAEYYIGQDNPKRAIPFLLDMERVVKLEKWTPLITDIQRIISKCNQVDIDQESGSPGGDAC